DATVTGVQTCALPISGQERDKTGWVFVPRSSSWAILRCPSGAGLSRRLNSVRSLLGAVLRQLRVDLRSKCARIGALAFTSTQARSEERRVGKEWKSVS